MSIRTYYGGCGSVPASSPAAPSSALLRTVTVGAVLGAIVGLLLPSTGATGATTEFRTPASSSPVRSVSIAASQPATIAGTIPPAARQSRDQDGVRFAASQAISPMLGTAPGLGTTSPALPGPWSLAMLVGALSAAIVGWRGRHLAWGPTNPQWQWQALTVSASPDSAVDATADATDDISPIRDVLREMEPRLCCPTCLRPLSGRVCRSCSLEYEDLGSFLDLTPASGRPIRADQDGSQARQPSPLMDLPFVKDSLPVIEQLERVLPSVGGLPRLSRVIKGEYLGDRPSWGKATFESPIVASVYERGWRQSFVRAGFPGPDEEFQKAMEWLRPVAKGKAVLDLSCGSGLFTRRFVASGDFAKVFALDYSESMLRQTRQGFDADAELSRQAAAADLELVRADAARLPFPSDSLPAIHAGAAIHCWPSPTLAMTEVTRVLAPGGRAVLSTFLVPGQDLPLLNEGLREVFIAPSAGRGMKYWEESELRDLCARVGLVNFEAERKRDYIIFKVEKPMV